MADEVKNIVPDPILQAFVESNKKKESEVTTPIPEVPAQPAAEEAPKEPEKVQEKVSEPPAVEQTTALGASWDSGLETSPDKPESSKFDFSKLGSALEFGEVKDESEFIGKVSELKNKLKQIQDAPLIGIPDEFKELIEITKKTGDWKTYLAESIVDYTKVSPTKLYEEQAYSELCKMARFRNADGSPKDQEIFDEIATVPEVTRTVEGSRIQRYLMDQQSLRKATIANQAKERLLDKEKELANSTKDLNQLLPFESYGIKFEAKHSNAIYEGVLTSKLTKKHLGVAYEDLVRSGANMKAITKTIVLAEHGEQMLKFKSDASLVKAKKEILAKVENVQLTTPAVPPAPETKEKSAWEKYRDQITASRGKF